MAGLLKKTVAFILCLFFSGNLWAESSLAVLEYHRRNGMTTETQKFSDRLREEFQRKFRSDVLTKEETERLFFYHKEGALKKGRNTTHELLVAGKKAYFNLKLSEAEKHFSAVIEKGEEETLVEGHLLMGLTQFAQGNELSARKFFREALRLDPGRKLAPSFFPPKVIRLFSKVAEEGFPTGTLQVESNLEGAEIWINGIFRGLAPLSLPRFPTGLHKVRLRANHYLSDVKRVVLKEGQKEDVTLNLQWQKKIPRSHFLGFSESELGAENSMSPVVSLLADDMGVSKVLLVGCVKDRGRERVEMMLVDAQLKSAHKTMSFDADHIAERSAEIARTAADQVAVKMREDLTDNPAKYVENRYEGDMVFIGHRRKPLYKKPLFWVLLGAVAAGGGIGAALAGSAGATAGSLGVVFQ